MRPKMLVGGALALGAFGALMVSGTQSGTMQAVPVSKLRQNDSTASSYVGQRLRAVGFVTHDPVRKTPRKTPNGTVSVHRFSVDDKGAVCEVEFADALPETFRLGSPVQVDGEYVAPGKIRADRVLTKCPSKYDAEAQAQDKRRQKKPGQMEPQTGTASS